MSEQWKEVGVSFIYGISSVGGTQGLGSGYCLLSPLTVMGSLSVACAKIQVWVNWRISEASIATSVLVLSKADLWIKRAASAFASKSIYHIFFLCLGISPFSFSCSLYGMYVQILLGVVLLTTYYKAIECNFFHWPSLIHKNSKL